MIEESWKRYDSISVHIYNNSTPRYMTNNWQRKEKMSNWIIIDFNALLSIFNRLTEHDQRYRRFD